MLADAHASEFKELVRRPVTGGELTVWQFTATLREFFSYERFPFDQQQAGRAFALLIPRPASLPSPTTPGTRGSIPR